jgi:hypothetical protein
VVDVVDFQAFLGATSQSQNDTPLLNQAWRGLLTHFFHDVRKILVQEVNAK